MTPNNIKSVITGGLDKPQLIKRLLNMRYTPDEIISELQITRYSLNEMVKAGAPIIREGRRVWIHGTSFAEWFTGVRKEAIEKAKQEKLNRVPGEIGLVYCLGCRRKIQFTEIRREGHIAWGTCPAGHRVTKTISSRDLINDQSK